MIQERSPYKSPLLDTVKSSPELNSFNHTVNVEEKGEGDQYHLISYCLSVLPSLVNFLLVDGFSR